MQIHDLPSPLSNRKKKTRVGRGGKRGTTAGRGTKGQGARAGHRIRPAERDYIQRLPKLRGHKNKLVNEKPEIINISVLQNKLKAGTVGLQVLREKGIIGKRVANVKILGSGEVKNAFVIEGLSVSKEARRKIEAAGGKIIEGK